MWTLHHQQVAALDHWDANGRIGITTGQEGWSASLIWQQRKDNYEMRVIAPLGQGTYLIKQEGDIFSLQTPEDVTYQAASAEALMQDQLGWTLPVAALRYWATGMPHPDWTVSALEIDDYGRLSQLQQAGWTIDYRDYQQQQTLDLPRKLIMKNAEARASLLFKQWQLRP